MSPRVSVIVPTRNRRAQLARALESVAAQRFRDLEVIVVDDGSTDGTVAWLRERCPGLVVLSHEHGGSAAARNRGIREAKGELVAFLDDDDVWRPGYLEAQVASLDAQPSADISFAGHVERDRAGRVRQPEIRPLIDFPTAFTRLVTESYIHTLSVVVCRASSLGRFGGFDEQLAIVHDLDWYARVLAGGGTIVHVPQPLVERAVPGGLVTNHRLWFREEQAVLKRLLPGPPGRGAHAGLVQAYRSLFFAAVGLRRGDLPFAAARLGSALAASTPWTLGIAARRLSRAAGRDRVEAAPTLAREVR